MPPDQTNERLEFLGDAILRAIQSEYFYAERPTAAAGKLTDERKLLENNQVLAAFGRRLGLEAFINAGKSDKPIADAVEALIGAMFLDFGYDHTRDFCLREVIPRLLESPDSQQIQAKMVAKNKLQEWTHQRGYAPRYEAQRRQARPGEPPIPEHLPIYDARVTLAGGLFAAGTGSNVKSAEVDAAINMLTALKKRGLL